MGGQWQWKGDMTFGKRTLANESDLWTLNLLDNAEPVLFYENTGSDQYAYLCVRDTDYSGTLVTNNLITGNIMRFRELV